jgi:hypothetical protein
VFRKREKEMSEEIEKDFDVMKIIDVFAMVKIVQELKVDRIKVMKDSKQD